MAVLGPDDGERSPSLGPCLGVRSCCSSAVCWYTSVTAVLSEMPLSVTVSVSRRFRPAERGVWVTARCTWPASHHARASKHKLCHEPQATSTMPEPHGPWLLALALWQRHVYEYCVTVRAFFCQALSNPWKPELSPRGGWGVSHLLTPKRQRTHCSSCLCLLLRGLLFGR